MRGEQDNISKVKVVFSFKYDLGRITQTDEKELKSDPKKIIDDIKKITDTSGNILYPNPQKDTSPPWEHFNRSYLSIRKASLILDSKPITIKLGNLSYNFEQTIKLYPGQRVISIILSVVLEKYSLSEMKEFFINFNRERGTEYTNYLFQNKDKCAKNWLGEIIDEIPPSQEFLSQLHLGGIVKGLRNGLNRDCDDFYCFQNYRILFFIYEKVGERTNYNNRLYALLTGINSPAHMPSEQIIKDIVNSASMYYQNKVILTGDWASVFLIEEDPQFEKDALFLFDLAHTLWFICQKWIYVIPDKFEEISKLFGEIEKFNRKELKKNHEYEKWIEDISKSIIGLYNDISIVQQSLIEVKDVDLMFYNSEYRKIMQKFYDSMKIMPHIELVESNLSSLDSFHQRLKDDLEHKLHFYTESKNMDFTNSTKNLTVLIAGTSGLVFVTFLKDAGLVGGFWLFIAGIVIFFLFLVFGYYINYISSIFDQGN